MESNWNTLRAQIEYFSKPFPSQAIAFANEHREEVAPYLVEVLAQVAANPAIVTEDPDYMLHEYATHLLAAWADTRAYAPLITLGHLDEDTLEAVLGDSVTESLARCLASVCDGDLAPLKALFEDPHASFWARSAALDAMVVRVMAGDLSREDLVPYLIERGDLEAARLRAGSTSLTELEILDCIVGVACGLAAKAMQSRIHAWIDESLVAPMLADRKWVDESMNRSFEETRQNKLAHGDIYMRDAEIEMGWWAAYKSAPGVANKSTGSSAAMQASDFLRMVSTPTKPVVRSTPKVGRNDPCPCGSGKKYKKCCGAG